MTAAAREALTKLVESLARAAARRDYQEGEKADG